MPLSVKLYEKHPEGLRGGKQTYNVSPSLEHHHGDRTSREGITDDELGNDTE